MSFHYFKLREKQISLTFSYFLINNALLHHFLANWLPHNKKMTEKSVFREVWSPEITSQSFPVSSFWSRRFVPHWKWNLTLLVHQNTGKENRCRKFFFAIHISTVRRFNRANKKICHVHFNNLGAKILSACSWTVVDSSLTIFLLAFSPIQELLWKEFAVQTQCHLSVRVYRQGIQMLV